MDQSKNLSITCLPVANPEDLEILKAFLAQNSLPHQGIQLQGNRFFLYTFGGKIVGCGGLEFYGDHCLLRSVAVAQELRGYGSGKEIVEDLIERATERPLWSISLLTETAETFFRKFGFETKSRDQVPKEIRLSNQFTTVCPDSAVFMSLDTSRSR